MEKADREEQQMRIQAYLELLKQDKLLYNAAEKTLEQYQDMADRNYAALFAPALVEYVLWVLKDAAKSGIERLYFLSRDAYPMYLVAKALTSGTSPELKTDIRYLRVSRYSLRMPEYHLLEEDSLDRIFLSGIDVSFYQILRRADLDRDEMQQICEEIRYSRDLYDILNRAEILRLKEQVKEACRNGQCSLLRIIHRHSSACYEDTIGYLTQEGMLEDIRYAVVDSGWVGTIQKSIQNLLATRKPDICLYGYYFGLYELPQDQSGCVYKAFYFMPHGNIYRKTRFSNCLYEVIYSEPCGMAKGYKKTEEGYEPVLSLILNPNRENLKKSEKVLQSYIRAVAEQPSLLQKEFSEEDKDAAKLTEQLYGRLMAHPSVWEAEYYGSLLFSDDLADEHMRKTANELTQKEIRDLRVLSKLKIMAGLSGKVIHESAWIEGTIVNGGEHITANLRSAHLAKALTHIRQSLKAK